MTTWLNTASLKTDLCLGEEDLMYHNLVSPSFAQSLEAQI